MSDNKTDGPSQPTPNESKQTEDGSQEYPSKGDQKSRKKDWRDWVLALVAAATIANGVVEITDMRKLNAVATQQAEISQQWKRGDQPTQQAKRELFASAQSQVSEIKEFMDRNRNEIRTTAHYSKQLMAHAQTAIDIANDAVSKASTEDAVTKAIKRQIQILESLLGSESERQKKRNLEECIEIADKTLGLLKLCGNVALLWATKTDPLNDGDESDPVAAQLHRQMRDSRSLGIDQELAITNLLGHVN